MYFAYDVDNRESTRHDALADTTTTTYDARSSVKKKIDPVGWTAYYDYDNLARLQHQSDALGDLTYFGYDARSSRIMVMNPRGNPTYFTYDALKRLQLQTDANGGVRYFGYDAVGNVIRKHDELGNWTYFDYDGDDRLSHTTDALGGVTYLGYDAVSNKVERIDADGRPIYFTYDGARRLTTQQDQQDGENIYLTYDSVGNLTNLNDVTGSFANDYDKLNRLVTKRTLAGGVYYQYDASSMKTLLIYPDDANGSYYAYDAAGRMIQVSPFDATSIRPAYYAYDASGLITKRALYGIMGKNVFAYYSYDVAGRVSELQNLDNSLSVLTYFSYGRDANGNNTTITREKGQTAYYAFDALDRVTSELWTTGVVVNAGFYYAYDAASNPREKQLLLGTGQTSYYGYDARNLLTQELLYPHPANPPFVNLYGYAYDNSQRMTTQYLQATDNPTPASIYYAYNQRDVLTKIQDFKPIGGGMADALRLFFPNGLNERVFVNDGDGGRYWSYDNGKLLEETDTSGVVQQVYKYNDVGCQDDMVGIVEHGQPQLTNKYSYTLLDIIGSLATEVFSGSNVTFKYSFFGEIFQGSQQRLGFLAKFFQGLTTQAQDVALGSFLIKRLGLLMSAVSLTDSPTRNLVLPITSFPLLRVGGGVRCLPTGTEFLGGGNASTALSLNVCPIIRVRGPGGGGVGFPPPPPVLPPPWQGWPFAPPPCTWVPSGRWLDSQPEEVTPWHWVRLQFHFGGMFSDQMYGVYSAECLCKFWESWVCVPDGPGERRGPFSHANGNLEWDVLLAGPIRRSAGRGDSDGNRPIWTVIVQGATQGLGGGRSGSASGSGSGSSDTPPLEFHEEDGLQVSNGYSIADLGKKPQCPKCQPFAPLPSVPWNPGPAQPR